MKAARFIAGLVAVLPAAAASCAVTSIQSILGNSLGVSTVLSATKLGDNSTYGNPYDIAYPRNATNLPASCIIVVNVTSSGTSSFQFGLMLPDDWNHRFLAVGNGGFLGGINWLDAGAGLQYGFAVMSTGEEFKVVRTTRNNILNKILATTQLRIYPGH